MLCNSSPVSCNRQPFLSDDSCDRGNVDIHQFDDLPFCDPINPTVPDIPPEVVDTPLNLPIPPACACINIDYKLGFKYTKNREFSASASFSARSDCCEGQYRSKINLNVPCPIDGHSSPYTLKVKAKYSHDSPSSVEYIKADSDSCLITPLSATLNVNIPCPLPEDRKPYRIKAKARFSKYEASAVSYLETGGSSCTIKPLSPTIQVNVPCPLPQDKKPYRIRAKAKFSNNDASSVSYLETGGASCTIKPLSPTIQVNVPCPLPKKPLKIKAKAKYSKDSASSVSYLEAESSSCALKLLSPTIQVNIPCPVLGDSKAYKIKAKAVYRKRDGFSSASAVDYLKVNASSCGLNFVDFDAPSFDTPLKVNIPCPVGARDESPWVCVKFDDLNGLDPIIVAHGRPFLDCWGRFKVVFIGDDGTTETVAEYGRDNVEAHVNAIFSIHGNIPGVGLTEFATYDGGGTPTSFTTDIRVTGGYMRIYGMTLQGSWVWAGSSPSEIYSTAPLVWCITIPKIAELPCGVMIYDEDEDDCLGTEVLSFFRTGGSISVFKLTSGGLCGISAEGKSLATFDLIDGIWTATSGTFCVDGMQISSSGEISSIHLIVYEQADDEEKERGGQMFMSIKYGRQGECGAAAAVAKFVEVDNDACAVNYLSPNIRLEIPCPMSVKKIFESSSEPPSSDSNSHYLRKGPIRIIPRNYFYIPYESSSFSSSSSANVIGWVKGDCEVLLRSKTILDIPPTRSAFFMEGAKITHQYMMIGRTMVHGKEKELECIKDPYDGLIIYIHVYYSDCDAYIDVDCGSSLPEDTCTDIYRAIYMYENDNWVDLRWMPVVLAMG